jgi:hypothetical protein
MLYKKLLLGFVFLYCTFNAHQLSAGDSEDTLEREAYTYTQEIQALATQLSPMFAEHPNDAKELIQHYFPLTQLKINNALAIQVMAFKKVISALLISKIAAHIHVDTFNSYLNAQLDKYLSKTKSGDPLILTWQTAQKQIIGLRQELWTMFIKALEADNITPPPTLDVYLFNGFTTALDENQSWAPLHENILAILGNQKATLTTSIIPIKQTNGFFKHLYDEDGINGISSFAKQETTHAVNAALTELYINDKLTYRGIRTGVLSAPCIIDAKARTTTALNKGKEILTLALVAYLENLSENQQNPENILNSKNVIEFPISSISLLTPIERPIPHPYKIPKTISETYEEPQLPRVSQYHQLQDQVAAWRQLSTEGAKIDIDWNNQHYTVTVKPKIYLFNFGVNSLALKNDQGVFEKGGGGWSYANSINEPTLKAILGNLDPKEPLAGLVGDYLNGKNLTSDTKAQLIQTLANQIRTIWSSQTYTQKSDPYKLPLRVTLLMHYLGHITIFNCMSGKDRTGMLDIMIKFWMSYHHLTGKTFEPNSNFANEEKLLFTAIALLGNNLPYQAYNVSIGGSVGRMKGKDPFLAFLISPTARTWCMGGSRIFHEVE